MLNNENKTHNLYKTIYYRIIINNKIFSITIWKNKYYTQHVQIDMIATGNNYFYINETKY